MEEINTTGFLVVITIVFIIFFWALSLPLKLITNTKDFILNLLKK